MPDIAKAKRNVKRMVDGGASEQEIDAYLGAEGLNAEQLRAPAMETSPNATPQAPPQAQAQPAAPLVPQGGSWMDPFIGQGVMMGAGDEIKAGVRAGARRVFGDNPDKSLGDLYEQELGSVRGDLSDFQERHPVLSPALEMGGAVATAPFIPGGVAARGANMGSRIARGAATGAGYGAVYGGASADGGISDRVRGAATGAVTGGVLGAAAPVAVRGVQAVGRGVRDMVRRPFAVGRGVVARDREAARRIGMAAQEDGGNMLAAHAGGSTPITNRNMLTQADEVAARTAGQPVLNIDRGGETVRALARSAANTSPAGRAAMEQPVSDRFAAQGDRTIEAVRRIVGGSTSAVNRETLERGARTANRKAYATAYRDGDRSVWSPTLERLTSSPAIVDAMRSAASRGKDRAVTEGFGGFNPGVTVDPSGIVTFQKGVTGVPTYPNLQYWDYVKRELDDAANAARRSGRKEEASTLGGLAEQLRGELDKLVPSFEAARAGAARFFGANDALEAGEQFVMSRMGNDAARQAWSKLSQPEQQLFAEGFADALSRRIAETGDRRNVINSIFLRSNASKERIEMALGPAKAKELEAFLRVEDLMDRARGAFGNSTTARQLTELGIAGGSGLYGTYTGDWKTTGTILGALLVKHGMGRVDIGVAQRVGEMLASPDPAVMQKGLAMVANNDRWMAALRLADLPAAIGATQAATRESGTRR